jgi:PAS domain S-box-containing protein
MDWLILLHLIPYLVSFLISAGIGVYAWRHRTGAGVAAYAVVALSQASWTLGYIFELLRPDLEGKIFWDNFQFIGGGGWLIGFVAFTLQYTGRHVSRPKLFYGLLSVPGVAIVALAFTDSLHRLVRPQVWLAPDAPFSALLYDFTLPVWVWAIYSYALFSLCVPMFIAKYVHTHRLYRVQVGLIVIGNLVPVSGTLLTLTGIVTIPRRDVSPFAFAIGNLIVALGLFHYHLFDVMPVARDAIIESMRDAVFVLDAQRRVVDLNRAARSAIDRMEADVIGQPAERVFAAWPDLLNRYRDLARDDHVEVQLDTPEGHRHVELTVQPLHDRRNRLVGQIAIAHDITARKLAEADLKQRTLQLESANEQLQALSRVKDAFVANVSHELRTPIANLKLYLSLLTRRPEKYSAYLAILERETRRLENLIEGLLVLSRLDQNCQELSLGALDINALAEEYVTDRAALAKSKGLALVMDVESALPAVQADPRLLGQAISILLTNAFNYTRTGGRVTVSTQTTTYDGKQWAGVSVKDTGLGILLEEQEQLFTRFFRGKAGRELGVPGTGLGLAIVKEIVKRHGGRAEVQSEGVPGKGTTMSIWLPISAS